MMELASRAVIFAAEAHDGMRRKQADTPYILHPMEAAVIVGTVTSDQHVIAAAALHDVVEDAGITIREVEERFGKRVAELVASETEDKMPPLPAASTWKARKSESLRILRETGDRDIKILYLGDKLANLRSIYHVWLKRGHELWLDFNQKDPAEQAWYYRSIADSIRDLSDTPAWQELNGLTETIFAEV